jgi:hypothetical protein
VTTCVRALGGVDAAATVGAPLLAATAMAAVLVALGGLPWLALPAGALLYLAVWILAERRISPGDHAFVAAMVGSRLPGRLRRDPADDPVRSLS